MKVTVFILEQKLNKLVSGDSFGPIRNQKCDQEVDQGQEKLRRERSREIPPPQVNTASRQAAEVKGHHRNPINGKRGGKRWRQTPPPTVNQTGFCRLIGSWLLAPFCTSLSPFPPLSVLYVSLSLSSLPSLPSLFPSSTSLLFLLSIFYLCLSADDIKSLVSHLVCFSPCSSVIWGVVCWLRPRRGFGAEV